MKLPSLFMERIKTQLGREYDAFLASFDEPYHVGLRINTRKIDRETFLEKFPFTLNQIPWNPDGFYYEAHDQIAKHPFFHAGLYYIQEPSAMAPVIALKPEAGDVTLDLCAAPGGKSMQIANATDDVGLLVTNDINETRVKAILRNVEKFGLRNVIVLNDSPEKIAKVVGNVFDNILIDAPCSGEGMFRKDPRALKAWETFGPEACSNMQKDILVHLEDLIKENTKIIYSTCTFSELENENQIESLTDDPDTFTPRDIVLEGLGNDGGASSHMVHIWPHKHPGEGHFLAGLIGHGKMSKVLELNEPNEPPAAFQEFMSKHMSSPLKGRFEVEGDKLFMRPDFKMPLKGLNVVREGLLLGEIKKGRFSPSQALALYLNSKDFSPIVDLLPDSVEVIKYLKGETIFVSVETEGLHLVCTEGYPLGFAKISNGTLKNQYPASWRML